MPKTPGDKIQRTDVMGLDQTAQLRLLGDELHRVATFVETKQLVQVPRALQDARELCEWLIPGQTNPLHAVLEDLSHRLQVWRTNWPRLQTEVGFRLAVARELRLWGQQVSTANVKRKSPRKPA